MRIFTVTIIDALHSKIQLNLEAANATTLSLGLNATLGMAGCQIMKIEEFVGCDY